MINYKRTKYSCYTAYLTMSSVFSLPPILFVTFREMYGISYTLLGTLVLINFLTQLGVDLIFTFFSKHFNIQKTIRIMPTLTSAGLFIYALSPFIMPDNIYTGLVIGTVIFSAASGLSEVLLSPLIAALPSENPDRDMSKLHSLYAYGILMVIIISTVFLKFFGTQNWMYLTFFWAVIPLAAFIMFCTSYIPQINLSENNKENKTNSKKFGLFLCTLCIFLGAAAENVMTNWISGYMETSLGISKVVGDILGMASFAILLALCRTLYAKYGKNIVKTLLISMICASICYLIAGLSPNAIISMTACIFTGFCTSMLWPGTLIMMEEKFPNSGVAAYALMAAGGDLGSSVAPQLMGIIVVTVSESKWAYNLSSVISLSTEQIGMKTGMVLSSIFPILGIFLLIYIIKYFKKINSR